MFENVLAANQALQQDCRTFLSWWSIETVETLGAEIPNARSELQPQKMEQREDDLGVASGIRRVLEDR